MAKWTKGGIKTSSSVGTAVPLSVTSVLCSIISIQALPLNTTRVVVGDSTAVAGASSGTTVSGGVFAILGAPSANTATPAETSIGRNGLPTLSPFDAKDLYIDVVTSGEGVVWSYVPA